jgi:hypothetical protein
MEVAESYICGYLKSFDKNLKHIEQIKSYLLLQYHRFRFISSFLPLRIGSRSGSRERENRKEGKRGIGS